MKQLYRLNFLSIALLTVGCGGGRSMTPYSIGAFINSPTKGIIYAASPSGLSGTTDENGSYNYISGDTVTFSIDLGATTLILGSTRHPSSSTSVLSLEVPNGGDPLAVAQILETLDKSSIDGKMDVSGISLTSGAVVNAISNALSSTSVSQAEIASIATGVQSALTASNAGNLKYGTSGVTLNDALANLSKNSANQDLLVNKIQNLTYDGSTVLDLQDKPIFTNWIIKINSVVLFQTRFGIITSNGLTYDFHYLTQNGSYNVNGTYTLANSNRSGNYNTSDGNVGIFSMQTGDSKSFSMTYKNTSNIYNNISNGETGVVAGNYLMPIAFNDILSKSFLLPSGCKNGEDNTLTIDHLGVSSDNCNTELNQATWSDGPIANTLQYTELNGTIHYVGITRINKNNMTGNLPSGATGSIISISSANNSMTSNPTAFKVN